MEEEEQEGGGGLGAAMTTRHRMESVTNCASNILFQSSELKTTTVAPTHTDTLTQANTQTRFTKPNEQVAETERKVLERTVFCVTTAFRHAIA